jgi:hypothetical protein
MKRTSVLLFVLGISLAFSLALGSLILFQYSKFKTIKVAVISCLGNPFSVKPVINIQPPTLVETRAFEPSLALFCVDLLLNFELAAVAETQLDSFLHGPLKLRHFFGSENIGSCLFDEVTQTHYILFRGTMTRKERAADLDYVQTQETHRGFLLLFQSCVTYLQTVDKVKKCVVVGHSLGAALATLAFEFLLIAGCDVVSYLFASPRVFSSAKLFHGKTNVFRITNKDDIVTNLPLAVMPNIKSPRQPLFYKHVGTAIEFEANHNSWLKNHLLPVYRLFLQHCKDEQDQKRTGTNE